MRLTGSFLIVCGFPLLVGASVFLPAGSLGVTTGPPPERQVESVPVAFFAFDGTVANGTATSVSGTLGGTASYVKGLEGQALGFGPGDPSSALTLDRTNLPLGTNQDFSVRFWIRTVVESHQQFVVLSQKNFPDNSLASQKEAGWVFYVSGWHLGLEHGLG